MEMNEEQKQALNDYLRASRDSIRYIKKRRKKRVIIFICIFFIFLFFLVNNPLTIILTQKQNLRYYDVRLNNIKLTAYEKIYDTIIIPYLMTIYNGNATRFSNENKNMSIEGKYFKLNIKSYDCFLKNNKHIKISCDEKSEYMYENDNVSYTNMQILKYDYDPIYEYNIDNNVDNNFLSRTYLVSEGSWRTRAFEEYIVIYDGKFMEDITSYISETSVYIIKLDFRYKSTKGTLHFGVLNNGENLFAL